VSPAGWPEPPGSPPPHSTQLATTPFWWRRWEPGLLEVADLIVVNKGDRPGAELAARQLRAMLSSVGGRITRQPPAILTTTALSGEGVDALADAIDAHRATARRPEQATQRARNQLRRAAAEIGVRAATAHPDWDKLVDAVAERRVDPVSAAERLVGLRP